METRIPQSGNGEGDRYRMYGSVTVMTGAEKVLIVGGVLNLAYGALLGSHRRDSFQSRACCPEVPDGGARRRAAARRGPARLGVGGPAVHAGLGLGGCGRWLLVVSSALIAAKDTLNWLSGVQDEFGEKAKTVALGALGAVGEPVGIGIFVVGVLQAL